MNVRPGTLIDESVGDKFQQNLLVQARNKTLEVIECAFEKVKPGMSEAEMLGEIVKIQKQLGLDKSWHAPQIRFGENTIQPYGKPGIKTITLKENDILFLDLGLVYQDHEGDVGRAYHIGDDEDMKRCCEDVKTLWHLVRDRWSESGLSGQELYDFASQKAEEMGWVLNFQKANGHRISDFPHAAKMRNSIQACDFKPQENRWILEIQIIHPSKQFGAFYEDLLN